MTEHAALPRVILTIGHSTRTMENFIRLLHLHAVEKVVDIRTVPRSRHNPQFNRETLPDALTTVGIGYVHMPGLGGLRRPRPDSINTGLTNSSFRGFADYMQTRGFEENVQALIACAQEEQIVLMCAEAVPWRCHRLLIADALWIRGVRVEHILGPARRQIHSLTPMAHASGTSLTYLPESSPVKPVM